MASILEVENLTMYFGGLAANKDVSFKVDEGMVLGLIGPNGAGKTTLFNCVTGFIEPTSGEVRFRGKRMNGIRPARVCKLGMTRTWQKVKPLGGMSVLDNVMVGAFCRTTSVAAAREIARAQLKRVGLSAKSNEFASVLPIGERKKLEVARALATGPTLILLDEVMGGLNKSEREEMLKLIGEIRKSGITQIVIEHDMGAIMRISDRVVCLSTGEKLAEGTPQEIVSNRLVIDAYLGKEDDDDK